jgi:hypothetical protein
MKKGICRKEEKSNKLNKKSRKEPEYSRPLKVCKSSSNSLKPLQVDIIEIFPQLSFMELI